VLLTPFLDVVPESAVGDELHWDEIVVGVLEDVVCGTDTMVPDARQCSHFAVEEVFFEGRVDAQKVDDFNCHGMLGLVSESLIC
jgi:hypothetical protein